MKAIRLRARWHFEKQPIELGWTVVVLRQLAHRRIEHRVPCAEPYDVQVKPHFASAAGDAQFAGYRHWMVGQRPVTL
jgi:hypothetical protein